MALYHKWGSRALSDPCSHMIHLLSKIIIRHDRFSARGLVVEIFIQADPKERAADVSPHCHIHTPAGSIRHSRISGLSGSEHIQAHLFGISFMRSLSRLERYVVGTFDTASLELPSSLTSSISAAFHQTSYLIHMDLAESLAEYIEGQPWQPC